MARGKKKYDPNVPEVLRAPIEYMTKMQLFASALMMTDAKSPMTTAHETAAQEELEQYRARLRALFEYYGLSPSDPNAKDKLILMMGQDLFRDGFKRVPKGTKLRVKATGWTVAAQLDLLVTVAMLRSGGMTVDAERMTIDEAAEYITAYKLLPKGVQATQDAKSIKTRYHEAKRLNERIDAQGPAMDDG
jgi:hypothetical protein